MDVAALFAEHHPPLFRFLSRLTGDPDAAADAAQEAFVRLVERPPVHGETRAWLFRVGTNAALQSSRTRTRRRALLNASPERVPVADPPETADAVLERDRRRGAVHSALQQLSDRERTVLLLREEGFSHREIAAHVGTTTGSVGTMIARALDKLAEALRLDEEQA